MSTTEPRRDARHPQHGCVSLWKTSTRLLLGIACVGVLAVGERSIAEGASNEDCRTFHQECVDARAQGDRDAGICNVERLECESSQRGGAGRGERDETQTLDLPLGRFSPPGGDGARSVR